MPRKFEVRAVLPGVKLYEYHPALLAWNEQAQKNGDNRSEFIRKALIAYIEKGNQLDRIETMLKNLVTCGVPMKPQDLEDVEIELDDFILSSEL